MIFAVVLSISYRYGSVIAVEHSLKLQPDQLSYECTKFLVLWGPSFSPLGFLQCDYYAAINDSM